MAEIFGSFARPYRKQHQGSYDNNSIFFFENSWLKITFAEITCCLITNRETILISFAFYTCKNNVVSFLANIRQQCNLCNNIINGKEENGFCFVFFPGKVYQTSIFLQGIIIIHLSTNMIDVVTDKPMIQATTNKSSNKTISTIIMSVATKTTKHVHLFIDNYKGHMKSTQTIKLKKKKFLGVS